MINKKSFFQIGDGATPNPPAPAQNTAESTENTPTPTPQVEPVEAEQQPIKTKVEEPKQEPINPFFKTISVPRQEVAEPPKQETEKETTPGTEETEEPGAEKPNTTKVGLTPQMQKAISVVVTEGLDYVFPKGIAMLYQTDNYEQYKADKEPKEITADGIRRLLAEKEAELTPWQQIVMGIGMGYGIPLGMAGFERITKYLDERKAHKENNTNPQYLAMQQELELLKLQKEQAQYDEPQPTAAPQPQTPPPTPQNNLKPGDQVRNCEECNKVYKVGEGYPIRTKSKHYDKFCGKSCLGRNVGRKGNQKRHNKNK